MHGDDADDHYVDIPADAPAYEDVHAARLQEEALLEMELSALDMQVQDEEEEEDGDAAIEMSASGTPGGGPGARRIPTAKLNVLLERQDVLRKKLQLLERRKELEEELRKQMRQPEQQQRGEPDNSLHCRQFRHLHEVGAGFWNIRGAFHVFAGMINLGTHMSVCRRANGRFIIIDTIKLPPEALAELKELTNDGRNVDAVIATHPYHTLAFRDFYAHFSGIPYFGTPRHLRTIPDIPWAGEVMANKALFEPDLDLRIPAGSEYVNPLPERTNHLSNVFVMHHSSKTVHNDDCVIVWERPPLLIRMMGYKDADMHFHPSLKGPGLFPTCEAPKAFHG